MRIGVRPLMPATFTFAMLVLVAKPVHADNCGSLTDCWRSAGPAAAAGAGAGGVGALAMRRRKRKKQSDDKCAGERKGVFEAQSRVDTARAKIKGINDQLKGLSGPADSLIQEAQQLAGEAQSEYSFAALEALMEVVVTTLAEAIATGGESAVAKGVHLWIELGSAGSHLGSLVEAVRMLYGRLTADQVTFMRRFAEENGLSKVTAFLRKYDELKELRDKLATLVNQGDAFKTELDDWERKLKEAQAALAECEARADGSQAA